VRGLVLGLLLGDSHPTSSGSGTPLPATVAGQLACFTIEGLIRASVRQEAKGNCHVPTVVGHAYCRWGWLQGIGTERLHRRWSDGTEGQWPDGWLADVPALTERRGSAPATVAALRQPRFGTIQAPTTASRGAHVVVRVAPFAAAASLLRMPGDSFIRMARELAVLTHGSAAGYDTATAAVLLLRRCLETDPAPSDSETSLPSAVEQALEGLRGHGLDHAPLSGISRVLNEARVRPASRSVLADLAPDRTAESALLGGLYCALSQPRRPQLRDALYLAFHAPNRAAVAAMTGAILGAWHGVEALPVSDVARLELAWPAEVLAGDLVRQMRQGASEDQYQNVTDQHWWGSYPGWQRSSAVPSPAEGSGDGGSGAECGDAGRDYRCLSLGSESSGSRSTTSWNDSSSVNWSRVVSPDGGTSAPPSGRTMRTSIRSPVAAAKAELAASLIEDADMWP
jgi:ADP-ribosylglycohydrolase